MLCWWGKEDNELVSLTTICQKSDKSLGINVPPLLRTVFCSLNIPFKIPQKNPKGRRTKHKVQVMEVNSCQSACKSSFSVGREYSISMFVFN